MCFILPNTLNFHKYYGKCSFYCTTIYMYIVFICLFLISFPNVDSLSGALSHKSNFYFARCTCRRYLELLIKVGPTY